MFWPPFTQVQQDQAQKKAAKLQLLGVVGERPKGREVSSHGVKDQCKAVSYVCPRWWPPWGQTGTMLYWPMCHKVLQRREVSSLGRLRLEASKNWANTGLQRNMCRGGGWRYPPVHLSPTWGSQDLPTAICTLTLCEFQSTAPHSLTRNRLSEQMGKSCWND